MKTEVSYGIIPLQKDQGEYLVLLIKHQAGHWAFPKGHACAQENPKETAARELKEETGLEIAHFLDLEPLNEIYTFSREQERIKKTVYYFLAEVKGKIILQEEEIAAYQWVTLSEAPRVATFAEAKKVCQELGQRLAKH